MEMTIFNKTILPEWLKNISNNDIVDVLDKGTSENYLPQWMSGKIDKIEYKIGSDEYLVPNKLMIHYIG